MPFTIPDKGEGLNDIQSVLFQEYLDVLVAGISRTDCVLSGLAVTAQGTPNMTVAVAAGAVNSKSARWAVAAANATITTADATNPRLDLVVITSAGAIAVRAGTAAAAPKPAARTANDVVLAVVYVPAGDTAIEANQITDMRIPRQYGPVCVRADITSGTTYTPAANVGMFMVMVRGATGGRASFAGGGGCGGSGYSEKLYRSPSGSYTYAIGAAGTSSGTDGGTTSFDVISITGSGGSTTAAGGAGGVATGGDFNANGGAGGAGIASTAAGGGGGGGGGRSGVGGTGAAATSGVGGGGGGTGGNNASGATAGVAGTLSGSAVPIPYYSDFSGEVFFAGVDGSAANGGNGAQGYTTLNRIDSFSNTSVNLTIAASIGLAGRGVGSASAGYAGQIIILEFLK